MTRPLNIEDVIVLRNLFDPPLSMIPLDPEKKRPARKWKRAIDGNPFNDNELRLMWGPSYNPGIACGRFSAGGIVVVDADNQAAIDWVEANLPVTRMQTLTRHGRHYYYRHPGQVVSNRVDVLRSKTRQHFLIEEFTGTSPVPKLRSSMSRRDREVAERQAAEARQWGNLHQPMGPVIDIRGDGGQVVAPGGIHPSGVRYRMAEPWSQDLLDSAPVFDPAWFEGRSFRPPEFEDRPETRPQAPCGTPVVVDTDVKARRARAWLARVDGAVQGQNGAGATFRVACALVLGFDLSEDDALRVLAEDFNPRCSPPWIAAELARKVRDAGRQPGQRGYKLTSLRPVSNPLDDLETDGMILDLIYAQESRSGTR